MILDTIVADKQQELAEKKRVRPLPSLAGEIERRAVADPVRDFAGGLRCCPNPAVIAEVKRASPSRGIINEHFHPVALAEMFYQEGAAAISVLTERKHFLGDEQYLKHVRAAVPLPVLRKDFLFDPYQIHESYALGADCVLLIAAILSQEQLSDLLALTANLGLGALVEVHDQQELAMAVSAGAVIIGINNRNLHTFETDIETTRILRPSIPPECLVISESGISNQQHMLALKDADVHGVLVGEALAGIDGRKKMQELISCGRG